uniref:40S ribosomal protein S21 n=1 Tax=Megaselia scalaris TaxID=36166 RepID=T1GYR7_MEGSC
MESDAGEFVDLYCPMKCTSSHRIIPAKDYASVQLNIANVHPETGRITGTSKVYTISEPSLRMGESDDCILRWAKKDGLLSKVL